jgi:hypothetical protein
MVIVIDTAFKQGGIVVWSGGIKGIYHISELTLAEFAALIKRTNAPIIAESVQLFGLGKIALANKYEAKGRLEAIAAMCNLPITWVAAKTWQKALGLSKKGFTDYQWKKLLHEKALEITDCSKEAADAVLITKYYEDFLRLEEEG